MLELRLHVLLAEKRLTQSKLGKMTGITQPVISNYCTGKSEYIKLEHIEMFCKIFNCEPNDLIKYKKDAEAPPNL